MGGGTEGGAKREELEEEWESRVEGGKEVGGVSGGGRREMAWARV